MPSRIFPKGTMFDFNSYFVSLISSSYPKLLISSRATGPPNFSDTYLEIVKHLGLYISYIFDK